jgi:hypothetical protein
MTDKKTSDWEDVPSNVGTWEDVAAPVDFSVPTKENLAESERQAKERAKLYKKQEPGIAEKALASPELLFAAVQNIPQLPSMAAAAKADPKKMAQLMEAYGYKFKTRGGQALAEDIAKATEGLPPVLGMGGAVGGALQAAAPAARQVAALPAIQKTVSRAEELGKGLKSGATYPIRRGVEAVVGKTTPSIEELARRREAKGYELEPSQLREVKPLGSPGYDLKRMRKNQTLANEEVTDATGNKAGLGKVTKDHLEKTQKQLGEKYDEIFGTEKKPKLLIIDDSLADAANKAAQFEAAVEPAKVPAISKTADNLLARWREAQSQNKPAALIEGRELQTLRSNLSDLTYRLSGKDKYRAGQLLREIDTAIENSNPEIAPVFRDTNKKYAANSLLLDLERKNGIMQGNVSLERLGELTKYLPPSHPLYEAGLAGRQLNMRGMFEGKQLPSGELSSALTKSKRMALGALTDSPFARSMQRRISEPPKE